MAIPLRDIEAKHLPLIDNLLSQGMGADRAFKTANKMLNVMPGAKNLIRRSVFRERRAFFRDELKVKSSLIPPQQSRRLTRGMAIPTHLKSKLGYKYNVVYSVEFYNTLTGQTHRKYERIGAYTLNTVGHFQRIAERRLQQYVDTTDTRYLDKFDVPNFETIQVEYLLQNAR